LLYLERNAHAEGLGNLGVLAARQIHIGDLGAFGRIIRQSLTLNDALLNAAKLMPSYNSAHRLWLEPHGDQVRLCHKYVRDFGLGRKFADQFTLSLLIDVVRVVTGPRWLPSEIHIERGVADGAISELFGAPSAARDVSAIVFDKALLAEPLVRRIGAGAGAHNADHALLQETAPASDFVSSLRQVIALFMRDDRLEIEQIAALFGLRARTLQRRLAEEGIQYSNLVAQVRYDQAIRLLADQAIEVTDIAHELGYSDAANFTRAFRQWAGMAPSAYRRLTAPARSPDTVQTMARAIASPR
jgi:AraC-like DNA-binding protein